MALYFHEYSPAEFTTSSSVNGFLRNLEKDSIFDNTCFFCFLILLWSWSIHFYSFFSPKTVNKESEPNFIYSNRILLGFCTSIPLT